MKYRLLLFLLFLGSVAYSQKYDDTAVICKGNGVRFINNDAVGSLPSVAWEWFIPVGGNINKTQGSPSDDVVFFADTGFFEVTEVATFSNGDTAHRYVLVQVIFDKVQNIPIKDTTLCYPGKSFSYTLDAGNAGLRFRYLWSTGQKTQTITIKDSGTYSVKVFNKCDTVTKTVRIKYLDAPVLDLGVTFFVCYDNPKVLDAGNAGSKYKWSTGDSSQTILVNKSGIFSVTVTNSAGCATTSSISLKDSCPPTIFLPNVFRPDGDGINDYFKAFYTGMSELKMTIYTRWGEKLYETNTPDIGWNGEYRGEIVENGVYMFMLFYVASNRQRGLIKGTFHLER